MSNKTAFWLLLLIGLSIGFCFGISLGVVITGSKWETATIEHGCSQYNPTTSKFEWVKK